MKMGDAGIFDLLLHKRDIAFNVVDFHIWLRQGGYNFVEYAMPGNFVSLSLNTHIAEKNLYEVLVQKSSVTQQATAELISGNRHLLWAYASKLNIIVRVLLALSTDKAVL